MDQGTLVAIGVLLIALASWQGYVRHDAAKTAAEHWLFRNGYRIRPGGRAPFLIRPYFRMRWSRSRDDAFEFRYEVDDRRLGGSGVIWLRVFVNWTGQILEEPETWWERMPRFEESATSPARTVDDVQFALLRRIADGESRFRPLDEHLPGAREQFDLLVEHVLALSRRRLVTCATPVAEIRVPGCQYRELSGVELTDEGRRVLAASAPSA